MYAVGRLGSYITRGVYTVSGPFHPFGGAVDIIVVEQPDGSFKSSPWYVRFGKFQGILKGREKVVTINVNGVETNIHMYLDPRGEAYFLRELEGEEADSLSYLSSSSDEMDEQSPRSRSSMKSKSCNYDDNNSNLGDQVSISDAEIVTQNSSGQSGITGLVLGKRSINTDEYQEGGDGAVLVRLNALERSEIAADLVENFIINGTDLKEKLVEISEISRSVDELTLQNADLENVIPRVTSNSEFENKIDRFACKNLNYKQASEEIGVVLPAFPVSKEESGLSRIRSNIYCETSRSSIVRFDGTKEQTENEDKLGAFPHKELDEKQSTHGREHLLPSFDVSKEKSSSCDIESFIYCETSESSLICDGSKERSENADMLGAFPFQKVDENRDSDEGNVVLPSFGVSEVVNRSSNIQSFSYCETSENSVMGLDSLKEKSESANLQGALSENLDEKQAYDGKGLESSGCGVSEEESRSSIVRSIYCETSENLVMQLDGSKEQSDIGDGPGAFHGKKLDGKQASGEREVLLPVFDVPQEESRSRNVMPIDHEAYESSVMELEDPRSQSEETLSITSNRPGEIHFGAETLHVTTESLLEDTVNSQAKDIELASEEIESLNVYSQQANLSSTVTHGNDEANPEESLTVSMPCVDPGHGLVEEVSKNIHSDSSFINAGNQIPKETNIGNKITRFELLPPLDSVIDPEQHNGKCGSAKAPAILLSESSEEEQFFFSDIDDFELRETQGELNFPDTVDEESNFPDAIVEENHRSICSDGVSILNRALKASDESRSSPAHFARKNGLENFAETLKLKSSPIEISGRHSVASGEDGRLTESLPDLWSHMGTKDLNHPLSHSLDLNSEPLQWELHERNESECVDLDSDDENLSERDYSNEEDANHLENIKNGVSSPASGDPSKAVVATGGSWRLWPFPFRRSRSRKTVQQPAVNDTIVSDVGEVTDGNIYSNGDKNAHEIKDSKMVKAVTPTSEELASLNLREGSNSVTFTFSTAMLGKQKVDARIYLWKWNTRIVISDVDGTITKSDVLGQFMPLVGIDWSQTGVAHLFSAIKDNGYQFLYLSARAIAQAYITRNFLVNLKQDGKALPDGPVVISPDGLFPSLYREVIRRAPHEFKIACLEDIRALFPPDCSPFYAGFGNRDTDEISYLKVGIPRGKIFIINPRGEVAVNRLVDTRSYTSLHALVHGMFPVMTSSEQEDFNSWNFWKLPPPDIDI